MHPINEALVFPDITQNEYLKSVFYREEPIGIRPTSKHNRKRRFKLLDLFCCAGGAGLGYKNGRVRRRWGGHQAPTELSIAVHSMRCA